MTSQVDHTARTDLRGHLGHLGGRYLLSAVNACNATFSSDLIDLLLIFSLKRRGRAGLEDDDLRVLTAPLPEDMRVVMSINNLAQAMDMPFETVRRHVRHLRDRGLIESDAHGVRISQRALGAVRVRTLVQRTWRLANGLVLDARTAGAPLPTPPGAAGDRRIYATRLSCDFIVDAFLVTRRKLHLQARDVLIFHALKCASVDPVLMEPDLGARFSPLESPMADDLRSPTTIYNLAKSLMLPYETVRRHVWRLVDAGLAEPKGRGFIVPCRVAEMQGVSRIRTAFAELSHSLIERLADAGAGAPPSFALTSRGLD